MYTYKKPKTVAVTDVNDSMHCYSENSIVELLGCYTRDGETKYVAQQVGTDYQQELTAKEWKKLPQPPFYFGKQGVICSHSVSANPELIHHIPAGSDVTITNHVSEFYYDCVYGDLKQVIDIRDINFF